jgi:hypothetical protein
MQHFKSGTGYELDCPLELDADLHSKCGSNILESKLHTLFKSKNDYLLNFKRTLQIPG